MEKNLICKTKFLFSIVRFKIRSFVFLFKIVLRVQKLCYFIILKRKIQNKCQNQNFEHVINIYQYKFLFFKFMINAFSNTVNATFATHLTLLIFDTSYILN
jgi:hypothetical protein